MGAEDFSYVTRKTPTGAALLAETTCRLLTRLATEKFE